jgi:hypothetical protein
MTHPSLTIAATVPGLLMTSPIISGTKKIPAPTILQRKRSLANVIVVRALGGLMRWLFINALHVLDLRYGTPRRRQES